MGKIRISAIVPVYNVQDYLKQCLDSLCQQSDPFDEVILVNDGSTDESQKICEKYCDRYNNFNLVNQSNQGLSSARNSGMKAAEGDYIVFIDSDDYVSLDKVSVIRKKLEADALEVLYYCADVKYETGNESSNNPYLRGEELYGHIMAGTEFFRKSFPQCYIVSACMAVYKKSFLERCNIMFPKGIYFEDYVFFVHVAMNAKRVVSIPNRLYTRRYRNDSIMTSKMNIKKCMDIIEVQLIIWELLHNQNEYKLELSFLRKFISYGMYQVIDKMSMLEDKTQLENSIKLLTNQFFEYWSSLFMTDEVTWEECGALLFVLKKMHLQIMYSEESNFISKFFKGISQYQEICHITERRFLSGIIKKLQELPLGYSGTKIGIYGIGNHTTKLIDLYQRYVGKIESYFYFIVTETKGIEKFLDKQVVDCNNIPHDTDKIIISSRVYQSEMKKQLIEDGIESNKIYTIYEKDEICDLVLAWNILNEK